MEYIITSGEITATVADRGAEIIHLRDRSGTERMWERRADIWGRCAPLLFPICGRLWEGKYTLGGQEYAMGTHGFLCDLIFTPVKVSESAVCLRACQNEKTRAVYPFDFAVEAEYRAEGAKLTCTYTVENTGGEVLPFSFGVHPGLVFPLEPGRRFDDYALYFDGDCSGAHISPLCNGSFVSRERLPYPMPENVLHLREAELLARDTMVFDSLPASFTLRADGGGTSLDFAYSDNFGFFCLWKAGDPGADFLCLEPWSGTPGPGKESEDFDTRGRMFRLPPKEKMSFFYSMQFRG